MALVGAAAKSPSHGLFCLGKTASERGTSFDNVAENLDVGSIDTS